MVLTHKQGKWVIFILLAKYSRLHAAVNNINSLTCKNSFSIFMWGVNSVYHSLFVLKSLVWGVNPFPTYINLNTILHEVVHVNNQPFEIAFLVGHLESFCGRHSRLGEPLTQASPRSSCLIIWVTANGWKCRLNALLRSTLSWETAGSTNPTRDHSLEHWRKDWSTS